MVFVFYFIFVEQLVVSYFVVCICGHTGCAVTFTRLCSYQIPLKICLFNMYRPRNLYVDKVTYKSTRITFFLWFYEPSVWHTTILFFYFDFTNTSFSFVFSFKNNNSLMTMNLQLLLKAIKKRRKRKRKVQSRMDLVNV